MDDSTGRNNLQDVADYLDRVLKYVQIDARDENGEPTEKVRWKELENKLQIYRNDPIMYNKLRDIYMRGFSNVLNPDPEMRRWY